MGSQIEDEDQYLLDSYRYGDSTLTPLSFTSPLRTFLFGYPIKHSLAPLLHKTLFTGLALPWTYTLHETPDATEFLPQLHASGVIGCAVTMPHKVSMVSEVDTITDEGRMIGAINTVFLRKDATGRTRYIGTNTDCVGVREAFLQNFPGILQKCHGHPALVIGGGGACRSAVYALWKWLGASRIYMVNRLESEVQTIRDDFKSKGFEGELVYVGSVEQANELEAPVLVVGTVPDFPPVEPGERLAKDITTAFLEKNQKGYVLEMCYHPNPRTAFFDLAEDAGWQVLPGTESMIYQGVAQQILWTEKSLSQFPLQQAKQVVKRDLLRL